MMNLNVGCKSESRGASKLRILIYESAWQIIWYIFYTLLNEKSSDNKKLFHYNINTLFLCWIIYKLINITNYFSTADWIQVATGQRSKIHRATRTISAPGKTILQALEIFDLVKRLNYVFTYVTSDTQLSFKDLASLQNKIL